MTTVREFKTAHSLTDAQFRYIRNKIQTAHNVKADALLIKLDSTEWEINAEYLDEFIANLPKPRATTRTQGTTNRWQSAIVPTTPVSIERQDNRTGQWLDIHETDTREQLSQARATIDEADVALDVLDSHRRALKQSRGNVRLAAMQDRLKQYRLEARFEALMRERILAEELNEEFTLGEELSAIATELGVAV